MADTPAPIKPRIYIIDDDKFLLDMYGLKFTDSGFDVTPMTDASEALVALGKETKIDAILLDIVMPGIDGFAFLEAFKKMPIATQTTVIILSNLGQKEDIEKGLKLGADGYIVKASSTPSEVVEKVKTIMGEHAH
ncbi:MAG: response regulator [Candidatus Vogelbacteria bacterium CG10_big_fil_rev_8_21_14_0_10_51_16]|uniref:Response regulator n=1 Tax=Candidatus Vogelbacteria bacterium CG10_big_fil_rev_8_21_14_0_10_51_16 TaxID=1975045 RepID=A0A2H0RER6_9BACT|nr:MAG: response regulator [Candidatus Vogelbacteria bacterium CG10_big_fil_rev_8_21_14_0_10_51_16]